MTLFDRVFGGNDYNYERTVAAIDAAIADGSMAKFVAEAGELANGETYEGLLDAEGNIQG